MRNPVQNGSQVLAVRHVVAINASATTLPLYWLRASGGPPLRDMVNGGERRAGSEEKTVAALSSSTRPARIPILLYYKFPQP